MIREFKGIQPQIHSTAYLHDNCEVIGRVRLEKDSSIWPFCVLRGDIEEIVIGEGSNVQDNSVLHTIEGQSVILGKGVSVGHSAILHGCKVKDHCIIGMGSIVLDGAVVEEDCIVGAGAVVSPRTVIPKGHMALGVPARAIRRLTPEEIQHIRWNAEEYVKLKEDYQ